MYEMKIAMFFHLIGSLMIVESRSNRHRRQAYAYGYVNYPSATAFGSNTLRGGETMGDIPSGYDYSIGNSISKLHMLC
jgi:hypothetical protein